MNHVKEVKILPRTVKNGDLPAAMNPDCQSPAEREFRLELSHKLRTPLNVIIGFTELVARRLGTAKDPDIQHILKSAREMLEIMNRELGDPNPDDEFTPCDDEANTAANFEITDAQLAGLGRELVGTQGDPGIVQVEPRFGRFAVIEVQWAPPSIVL